MNIALHDAEKEYLKNKTFPNFALMKISAYHKSKGGNIQWFSPLHTYDIVYSSKIFDFTPVNDYLPENTIKGGTGYGLYEDLPVEIDSCYPDYSIYPECDYAIGFLTRGCPNKCDWCYVPKKEGNIRSYEKWQNVVRNDTKKLVLMDIRCLNDEICKIIKNIKWLKYIRFSCDSKSQIPYFEKAINLFDKYKIPKSKVFIYTLVRKDLSDADERIQALHKLCRNFNIYAQPQRNEGIYPNKLQMEFTQRFVYGRSYKKETWKEYLTRKGADAQK